MTANKKIMGGMFGSEGMDYIEQPLPLFLQEPCLKLINGRSGIQILCDLLGPRKVWMPSYLCHSMTKAVPQRCSLEFFPINENLQIKNLDWLQAVSRGDLVLFIDYFGFNPNHEVMQAVKERGAWILQDAAQALLSTFERPFADFVLYSPRKTVGIPDGGILKSQCDVDFSDVLLKDPPPEFVLAATNVFWARTLFDRTGAGDWFSLYRMTESLNPIGGYRMTDLSLALLKNGFDYDQIARTRRSNYRALYESLSRVSLLGELFDNVVPLGFPIICSHREKLLSELYAQKIFCPVHWPLAGVVPEIFNGAHWLSQKILTVLCDQRLCESQINQLRRKVRERI